MEGMSTKLLYEPIKDTVRVQSCDGKTVYEEGKDFLVKGNQIILA